MKQFIKLVEDNGAKPSVNLGDTGVPISFEYKGVTYPAVTFGMIARFVNDVKVLDEHHLNNIKILEEAGKSLGEIVMTLKKQFEGADKILEIEKLIQEGIKQRDEELQGTLLYKRSITKKLVKFRQEDVICTTINGSNYEFTYGGICYHGVVLSQGQIGEQWTTGTKLFKWNGEILAYSSSRFGELFDKFDSLQIRDLFTMGKSKQREFNIGRMKRFLSDELGCEYDDIYVDETQNTIFCNGEDLVKKLLV